jgi:MFS superfamily sulfate permease-like transporter
MPDRGASVAAIPEEAAPGRAASAQRFTSLRGDIVGGATAALLTIPASMGYGVLALQSLGEPYVAQAVLAGLYSAIFIPLAVLAFGGRMATMYAPRSVVALLVGSIVLQTIASSPAARGGALAGDTMFALVLSLIVVAGLFQALFGALRLGAVIKYIPSPVMAGFQNAVAILILLSQVETLLGFRRHVPLSELTRHLGAVQPLTLLVGLVTFAVIWYSPKLSRRVPAVPAGLVAGTAVYHLLATLGAGDVLGPVIGAMPPALPTPHYLVSLIALPAQAEIRALGPAVVSAAFSLAIIASLDALLCAKTVEAVTGRKTNGSHELLRLGLANATAACFGGISGGINLGASLANHRAGGRSAVSVAVSALVILGVAMFLGPVIALLPRVVIAATLVVVAIQLVDRWSLRLVRDLVTRTTADWKVPAFDLFVVALVATVTIALNLVAAVGVGVAIAVASFLLRMSRSVVRRSYRGDVARSKRMRDPELMELLAREGRRIVVFELEGALFFGTAEDLAARIEAGVRDGVTIVILDLRRANDIDSTGARILLQVHDGLRREGKWLLLSHAEDNPVVSTALQTMGVASAVGPAAMFHDSDAALEHAENLMIAAHRADPVGTTELALDALPLLEGLTPEQRARLGALLIRRVYRAGDVVVQEGEEDHSLLMIARGTASVKIKRAGRERYRRLAGFSPGTVFGEVALLDRQPRSATVTADEDLVCYVLPEDAFHALTVDDPPIAIHLLANLGRELSRRLRRATAMMSQLED